MKILPLTAYHGILQGLADDDHTQYLLANGTRALGGHWDLGGFNLTGVGNITGSDLDISAGTGDYTSTGTLGAGAITGTSLTDGTTTISGGNYTGVGDITGSDVNISAGTGDYTSTGDVTLSGTATAQAPTLIATTLIEAPILETEGLTDVLHIQPDEIGLAVGADFFATSTASAGNRPRLRLYGYGASAQKYGEMYIDAFDRFVFTGTMASTFFETPLAATGFYFPAAQVYQLGVHTVGTVDHASFKLGTSGNYTRALVFHDDFGTNFDFQIAAQTHPTVFFHSSNETVGQQIGIRHNGTDGQIFTDFGDISLLPKAGSYVTAGDGTNETQISATGDVTFAGTARLRLSSVTDAGPMTATNGTAGDIVFNTSDTKAYVCTVTGTPATWAALN